LKTGAVDALEIQCFAFQATQGRRAGKFVNVEYEEMWKGAMVSCEPSSPHLTGGMKHQNFNTEAGFHENC
jgi:hypothetical protein